MNTEDKNFRPYLISIDWLQLHLRIPEGFDPNQPSLLGYSLLKLYRKSQEFNAWYEVYEPDGVLIGTLTMEPTSPIINKRCAIFKADNTILYEANLIERIFNFIGNYGLQYRGITRIDICYDCNDLYGGLKHQTLIHKYWVDEYLKIGNNKVAVYANKGYNLSIDKRGFRKITDNIPNSGRKIGNIPKIMYESVRWGSRASDICVSLYNKSLELKQVKMKHHIVNAWKAAGLNPDQDVYRIEICIRNCGKQLKNLKNGKRFELQISDFATQEMIEQMFADYSHKYFRLFHNKGIKKIQQMKEVRMFCFCNQRVVRPQRCTKSKDYTKMHKMFINYMESMITAHRAEGNELADRFEELLKATIRIYNMEKWYAERGEERQRRLDEFTQHNQDNEQRYYTYFEGTPKPIAVRAAKYQKQVEERLNYLHQALIEEEQDLTGLFVKDLFD